MDETILPPSPNWFQVSGLAVSKDGWVVYGGPSKSLCLLEPLSAEYKGIIKGPRYHAHVFNRVHTEKIVSVDLSPEWPEKRTILTGSADGSVKHWCVEKLLQSNKVKPMLSHDVHSIEKEEIAGVSYSSDTYAVTVGVFGTLVKWDLNSNVVKTYIHLKNFKPLCMACSPHLPLHVAIGTKQGVVFVLDLQGEGNGKILYKVRGQDDEIINISWCPQFEVTLNKTLKESDKRKNRGKLGKNIAPKSLTEEGKLDASALDKSLPEDSFDGATNEEIVEEDDMFDIYKDHEADEFGHKKYEPEEIYVKVEDDKKEDDYLAECLKLKEEIMKRKAQGESSMQSLVNALDNTHVDGKENSNSACNTDPLNNDDPPSKDKNKSDDLKSISSVHIHKHLLASIGKSGGVRIWSKSGKLVASCVVPNNMNAMKGQKVKLPHWPSVLWVKPDLLLLADGKSQLLECNPLKIDCKNKLDWSIVHGLHKRGLYSITSNAPRVQTGTESSEDWNVYTSSQDRNIIQYSMTKKETVSVLSTSGGFIYTISPCPYDAGKVAFSVGDGAVRIWETSTLEDDDSKLIPGQVTLYWQNVQGKVLTVAWHPTRENMLAFATAESRIGLLDISGKVEKPAKVLPASLNGPIYSISWGEGYDLYAVAGGSLVKYRANKIDEPAQAIEVMVEAARWEVSSVCWTARGALCGGGAGGVALLEASAPHAVVAATLVFSKMIHMAVWHPQQTSNSNEESPYKDLIAVCSCEKYGNIVILEYSEKPDSSKQLQRYKTLSGHKLTVLQLAWNPHRDELLLSTSQDHTVRIWDVVAGACVSVFPGHGASALSAAWPSAPGLARAVLSGGSDAAARLWSLHRHPAHATKENEIEQVVKTETRKKRPQKSKKKAVKKEKEEEDLLASGVAVKTDPHHNTKGPKKFLLPLLSRPHKRDALLHSAKIIFKKYLENTSTNDDMKEKISSEIDRKQKDFSERSDEESSGTSEEDDSIEGANVSQYNFDYLKIFGSNNEVNEILDRQMWQHQVMHNFEAWVMLAILRGHIDSMIQYASKKDMLCPFLISVAPCVSFKYWKDVTQLYLAQIERLTAKGHERKFEAEFKRFGGMVYRRAAALLALHDVRGAVRALTAARLHREAYVLCRVRHMDSIAEETLKAWAAELMKSGVYIDAAICYLVLGNLADAAAALGKLDDQDCLGLAADIAKVAGQNMLVEHISEKKEIIKNTPVPDKTEEMLEQLPTRLQLLMKDGEKRNGVDGESVVPLVNGNEAKESS